MTMEYKFTSTIEDISLKSIMKEVQKHNVFMIVGPEDVRLGLGKYIRPGSNIISLNKHGTFCLKNAVFEEQPTLSTHLTDVIPKKQIAEFVHTVDKIIKYIQDIETKEVTTHVRCW